MSVADNSAPRELPLVVGPGKGAVETLLLLGVPDSDGVVHVRSWTSQDWSAPPTVRAERAESLLAWCEAESRAGRPMNQSLYAVRLWLRGEGKGIR
jgi:hypothetical protein